MTLILFLLLKLNILSLFKQQSIISNIDNSSKALFHLNNFNKLDDQEVNYLPLNTDEISASALIVKEINGKTLLAKNHFKKKSIASLTKLMSAYLTYNLYNENDIFTFDEESLSQQGEVGNFSKNQQIDRNQALKASLISSSNDAIFLLAKKYGLDDFVNLMNKKAEEWGMRNTQFVDPMGINEKNISTAYDLYLLSEKIYSLAPEIFDFTRQEKLVINNSILWTTNIILPKYKNIIIGAKTGYTQKSKECLLVILKFEKSPFINIVILESQDRFGDFEKITQALKNYYGL